MAAQGAQVVIPYAVNFSIVIVILAVATKKPLRKYLYQRHERMKDAFEAAKIAFAKSEARHSAAKQAVDSLSAETSSIEAREKQFADQERASILSKAKEESQRIAAEVERLAQVEQEESSERVKNQFLDLVIRDTEEALKKGLKKDDHSAIVKRAQNSIEVGI